MLSKKREQKTKLKNITAHFQKVESEILRTHQLVGDEWLWNWWETITQEFIPIIAYITTISFYIEKKNPITHEMMSQQSK